MSARRFTRVLVAAAGASFGAWLIPSATSPVAYADDGIDLAAASAAADPAAVLPAADGFISATDSLFSAFGITDIGAANPEEGFAAMILEIPQFGITDVLTSGTESVNDLAQFGVPDDLGLGTANVTVNTFIDTMNPALDSSSTIPFTDPIAGLWDVLVANDFFGL
jgi:hypothetical protein